MNEDYTLKNLSPLDSYIYPLLDSASFTVSSLIWEKSKEKVITQNIKRFVDKNIPNKAHILETLPELIGKELVFIIFSSLIKSQSILDITNDRLLEITNSLENYLNLPINADFAENYPKDLNSSYQKILLNLVGLINLYNLPKEKIIQKFKLDTNEVLNNKVKKEIIINFHSVISPFLTLAKVSILAINEISSLALISREESKFTPTNESSFFYKIIGKCNKASLISECVLAEIFDNLYMRLSNNNNLEQVKFRVVSDEVKLKVSDLFLPFGLINSLPLEEGDTTLLKEGINRVITIQEQTRSTKTLREVNFASLYNNLKYSEELVQKVEHYFYELLGSTDNFFNSYFFQGDMPNCELIFATRFKVFSRALGMIKDPEVFNQDETIIALFGSSVLTNKFAYVFNEKFMVIKKIPIKELFDPKKLFIKNDVNILLVSYEDDVSVVFRGLAYKKEFLQERLLMVFEAILKASHDYIL